MCKIPTFQALVRRSRLDFGLLLPEKGLGSIGECSRGFKCTICAPAQLKTGQQTHISLGIRIAVETELSEPVAVPWPES